MNFLELAKERYSVRKFDGRKVEADKVKSILEAGRLSPTAVNYQPQRVLVLDDEERLAKLKDCTPYHFHAPLALIVCYDTTTSWKRPYDGKDMGEVDAAIVTTRMMLQIAELGLGTTWVGRFDPVALRKAYAIPEELIPVAILPTGYPASGAQPSPMHEKRLDEKETVFYNAF